MAKDKGGTVKFGQALAHLQAGKKITNAKWEKEFQHLRIDDTGLGLNGEFIRLGMDNRGTRYNFSTSDILSDDWILL